MAPVRVARAFRLPIIATTIALALSGCMQTAGLVAGAQPSSDLDYMAYGQPYSPAPAVAADSSGGRAISALRNSFASASPRSYTSTPAPVPYAAAAPAPGYDAAYRLDAGDKLRVVVYGQEGRTTTHAVDARRP